ncbi:MAG: hypothetical protein C5S45_01045 [Candidatus Methanocomedens sp.]|nr:MAG: hypothetical protein C5S45_01045 [ANME-2 cluster archaeon]
MTDNSINQNAGGTHEVLHPIREDIVGNVKTQQIEPFFHPTSVQKPSPEYIQFVEVREEILIVIRNKIEPKDKFLDEIIDAILDADPSVPTGIDAFVRNVLSCGKVYLKKKHKKELLRNVVISLLEQIFDPALEFKMNPKDILHAFEANGIGRENIFLKQISQIYIKILHKIRVGVLRDLTYEQQLQLYVKMKINEIDTARIYWELSYIC